ncbi:hypothetical protein [uncultured Muribaculum sp.]|nr:hypothetical protein [uncultured Muribaculum sp.]
MLNNKIVFLKEGSGTGGTSRQYTASINPQTGPYLPGMSRI